MTTSARNPDTPGRSLETGGRSLTAKIVDLGSGPPLVLVPGVQGRWEWMTPAVQALARRFRVITFSLADDRTGAPAGPDAHDGFWRYVRQIEEAMDRCALQQATVCGVSYGGLVAAAFAARHPERVHALVLVSALPPGWRPDARARFFLRAPRLLLPLFFIASLRMYREIAAASATFPLSLATSARHAFNALTHMFSPREMARRVRLLDSLDLREELSRLNVRTLVITGDDGLDRIVPPALTREYLRMWPHAESATLARTGHIGLITKPEEFARLVGDFVESAQDRRRKLG